MKDTYELPISTPAAAAADAYNRSLKSFIGFDADLPVHAQAALQADPQFVMGHCLWGYFLMLAYSRDTLPAAAEASRAARRHVRGAFRRRPAAHGGLCQPRDGQRARPVRRDEQRLRVRRFHRAAEPPSSASAPITSGSPRAAVRQIIGRTPARS